jgi:hypothetical protein
MILTANLINGVDFLPRTLVRGFGIADSSGDRMGTCTFTVLGKPSDLNSLLVPGATVEILAAPSGGTGGGGGGSGAGAVYGGIMFGEAVFGQAGYGGSGSGGGGGSSGGSAGTPPAVPGLPMYGEVVYGDPGSPGTVVTTDSSRIFYGRVISVSPLAETVGAASGGWTQYLLACRAYGDLLNTAIITTPVTYTAVTDKAIILALLALYLPEVGTAGVTSTTSIASITFENISVRQALENLVALTGAEFYIDSDKILQYHVPSANVAPFSFSETPDNVSSFQPLVKPTYLWDFSSGANRIVVLGQIQSDGTVIKSTRNHPASQGTYGVMSKVVVDRSISTQVQADVTGDIQLAQFANPIQSGTVKTSRDGLVLGMYLTLDLPAINVIGSFVIKKITTTWDSPWITTYTIEWGDYLPDLPRLLRKLALIAPQSPVPPAPVAPPGGWGPGSFAGTIQPVYIVGAIPAVPDSAYPINSVAILTTDSKLYRKTAPNTWTAVVPTSDLTGQITTTQISDNAISTPKIAALAITSSLIAADAIIAGKIGVGAIRASDAVFFDAAVNTAAIQDAAITTAKIGNLQVTTAKIADLQITNAKIADATIDHAKIASIDAATITVGTLSGTMLQDGTVADIKIASGLNASKITTGTMQADRITAGTIGVGGGKLVINGSGTIALEVFGGNTFHNDVGIGGNTILGGTLTVSGSGFSTTLQSVSTLNISCTSLTVRTAAHGSIDSSGVADFLALQMQGVTAYDTAGNNYANSYNIGGNRVVFNRQTGPGTPSFASLANAQTWCAALLTALQTHGLVT